MRTCPADLRSGPWSERALRANSLGQKWGMRVGLGLLTMEHRNLMAAGLELTWGQMSYTKFGWTRES